MAGHRRERESVNSMSAQDLEAQEVVFVKKISSD